MKMLFFLTNIVEAIAYQDFVCRFEIGFKHRQWENLCIYIWII